jgi:multicomponent Na+:H+ antiporter subunit A
VILESPLWRDDPVFASTVGVLIAVAAFTKSAQFPFHAWLPNSMVAATPISAYLHAAAMVKAGIYLLMRFSPALSTTPVWIVLLVSVGLLTGVMGALFALQRSDLKELLAYSTVSQLGLLVAVIGLGTKEALTAAAVHTVAHALFKGALFMFIGFVDHEAGTREVDQLSGLWRAMPVTTVGVVLAALSMAGVVPLLGFISKEKIFAAFWDAPGPGWIGPSTAVVAVAVSVLTVAYSGRIVLGAFLGPPLDRAVHEASASFLAPVMALALASLVLGPGAILIEPVVTAAGDEATVGPVESTDLSLWHGFVPELWLSIASVALGLGLIAA